MGTRRGGKRTAGEGKRIGRPPNPVKGLKTSAATAERILRDLDYENEITEIYRNCGGYQLKVQRRVTEAPHEHVPLKDGRS